MRVSYRTIFARMRPALVRWVLFGVLVAVVVSPVLAVIGRPHNPQQPNATEPATTRVIAAALTIAGYAFLALFSRRSGYYIADREVGILSPVGTRHRLHRQPVRWERATIANSRWVAWVGYAGLVSIPVAVALNAAGQREFVLTSAFYPPADVDHFIAASRLPVTGDGSECVPRSGFPKRWPAPPDVRFQSLVTLAWFAPAAVLIALGLFFWFAR